MYKQFTLIIDFGRIYLYIGADITWWSIECPFDDNDSRLFPAIHFLGIRLNIERLFKNKFTGSKENWTEVIFNPL